MIKLEKNYLNLKRRWFLLICQNHWKMEKNSTFTLEMTKRQWIVFKHIQ